MKILNCEDIADGALGAAVGFISCLSFEERSLAAAKCMASAGFTVWYCLENSDIETDISEQRDLAHKIARSAGIELRILETSKRNPLALADALVAIADETRHSKIHWVIDVSTMTHEIVLVLASAIEELSPSWKSPTIVYNAAGQYSPGEADEGRRWISRGIQCVRSVLGYPGLWSPGESTTLIALPGFDLERVHRVVEEIEPHQVLVGVGRPSKAEHEWLYGRNRAVAEQLLSTRPGRIFEYQTLDPLSVASAVLEAVGAVADNVLIAPFNSKISTLALGLLALRHPSWQVCYAPALVYNLDYATASNEFMHFEYSELSGQVANLSKLLAKRKAAGKLPVTPPPSATLR